MIMVTMWNVVALFCLFWVRCMSAPAVSLSERSQNLTDEAKFDENPVLEDNFFSYLYTLLGETSVDSQDSTDTTATTISSDIASSSVVPEDIEVSVPPRFKYMESRMSTSHGPLVNSVSPSTLSTTTKSHENAQITSRSTIVSSITEAGPSQVFTASAVTSNRNVVSEEGTLDNERSAGSEVRQDESSVPGGMSMNTVTVSAEHARFTTLEASTIEVTTRTSTSEVSVPPRFKYMASHLASEAEGLDRKVDVVDHRTSHEHTLVSTPFSYSRASERGTDVHLELQIINEKLTLEVKKLREEIEVVKSKLEECNEGKVREWLPYYN